MSVQDVNGRVSTVSICSITIDDKIKKKLERYLDATRGELFFARRILMVEGISEVLLLPVLAKILGGNLKESSVTVLNADGLNFNAFIPLFGEGRLSVPVVILTDGDAKEIGGKISATADGLKKLAPEVPYLEVEMAERTLEHELARSDELRLLMITAFKELRPCKGAELEHNCNKLDSADDRADEFLKTFRESRVSKGRFAQELAGALGECDIGPEAVPTYIRNALSHLGVLSEEAGDDLD